MSSNKVEKPFLNTLKTLINRSNDRIDLCKHIINQNDIKHVLELGVFRGDFARDILEGCSQIESYTMIDPWRNLSDWNKPSNLDQDTFDQFYQETIEKTAFAKSKLKILRGKTTEVIDEIQDNSVDLAYIDGDHTLKGIAIDLINIWPKIKAGGYIIGDDFSHTIWQHDKKYEPTMVFPFAVYFAEALGVKVYGLPFKQFLIAKNEPGFKFIDLSGGLYKDLGLKSQFTAESPSFYRRISRTIRKLIKS